MLSTISQALLRWILLLTISLLLMSCSDDSASSKDGKGRGGFNKPASKPIPVELALPEIGTASSYYVTTATLSASSNAKINARTAGVIREILHEEGDDVKAGTVLLLLENEDQKLRLKQAQITLTSAEQAFNRLNKMQKVGAVSANDWETSNNAYLNAEAAVELAELALSYTKIIAPFNGRLVWREVDLGAYVSNGELLFRIMAIDPLLLRVFIPANRLEKIAVGQKVTLMIDSVAQEVEAEVSLISPIVDPTSGTIKITVRLDDYPEGVRPGDFTEIHMVTNSRDNALLLPSVAIIEERGQNYLYIEKDNKANRKNIEVGYVLGERTEILSGISETDKVVIKGHRNLNQGNLLKVIDSTQTNLKVVNKNKNNKQNKQGRTKRNKS